MKLFPLILLLILANSLFGQPVDKAYKPGWKLVFFDEFDSNRLNIKKWKQSPGWTKCIRDNLAYSPEDNNVSFKNGNLVITAKKENVDRKCDNWDSTGRYIPYQRKFDYTTGLIYTVKDFKYGYFECRFKVPEGKGFNSAFWLIGTNSELDIFEILGSNARKAYMTLHWKDKDARTGMHMAVSNYSLRNSSYSNEYHVMATEWTDRGIRFFSDSKSIPLKTKNRKAMLRHMPACNMNVLLSLGVGIIDGSPDEKTNFPAEFLVDYVRVYSHDTSEKAEINIKGQKTIIIDSKSDSQDFSLSDLVINDRYGMYPHGYAVKLKNSTSEKINEKESIITNLITVTNGIDESEPYQVKILKSDSNYQTEKFPAGYEIIARPDKNTVTLVSYSGEFMFDNIFLADSKMNSTAFSIERAENQYIIKPDKQISGKYFLVLLIYNRIYSFPVIF